MLAVSSTSAATACKVKDPFDVRINVSVNMHTNNFFNVFIMTAHPFLIKCMKLL